MTKVYMRNKQSKECGTSNAPGQESNRDGSLCESLRRFAARGIHWQSRFSRPKRFRGRFPLRYGAGQLYTNDMLACCNLIS